MKTTKKAQHGIVVPCYNESSRLEVAEFIRFAKAEKNIHICLINDGSKDMTRATLADVRATVSDNIYAVSLEENVGKAEAVRQGALFLHEETEVDTIGFLDADLSTSFEDYQDLLKAYEESDKKIIFGSRNMGGASEIERNPLRKLVSDFIKLLIRLITRLRIADTQCGAKVFSADLIPFIYQTSFFSRWLFDIEILLRMKKKYGVAFFKSIFSEVPLNKWVHKDDSKLSSKDALMIPFNLLKIWMEYELKPALKGFFSLALKPSRV